jgi:hypothetical protein
MSDGLALWAHRAGPVALAVALAGCSGAGPKKISDIAATPATSSGSYSSPLDAVASSDGKTFYFSATAGEGTPGIFSVSAAGGAAALLASGDPLVSPIGLGISKDDQQLFIADPGMEGTSEEKGQMYTLPVSGGALAPLSGTLGYQPRGLDVVGDQITFSGVDPADAAPGVFRMGTGGGVPQVIAKGTAIVDPSGIVVTKKGDVFVADTSPDGASVLSVTNGQAAVFVDNLKLGYPAGIALDLDETTLLISGHDAVTGTSLVYAVDLTTKKVATVNTGIGDNVDSGGLHRARVSNTFAWCGSTAGASGGGTVYNVQLK